MKRDIDTCGQYSILQAQGIHRIYRLYSVPDAETPVPITLQSKSAGTLTESYMHLIRVILVPEGITVETSSDISFQMLKKRPRFSVVNKPMQSCQEELRNRLLYCSYGGDVQSTRQVSLRYRHPYYPKVNENVRIYIMIVYTTYLEKLGIAI